MNITGDDIQLARVTINDSGHTGIRLVNADRIDAEDIEINNPIGIGVNGRDSSATFDNLAIRSPGETGLLWEQGSLTVNTGEVIDGTCHGIQADDAALALTHLRIAGNGCMGALLRGSVSGTLTRSNIVDNANAGVSVLHLLGRDPTVSVTRNNIHSNASAGARRYSFLGSVLSATDNDSGAASAQSGLYTVPAGHTLESVEVGFTVTGGLTGTGDLLDGGSGAVLTSLNATADRQFATQATRLRVRANLTRCCGSATMTLRQAHLAGLSTEAQLVVSRLNGTVDARENYLGRYPDVLPAVAFSTPGAVDIQGFVGLPFGEDFDTGPYYGGRTLNAAVEWAGIVYVSGDVIVGGQGSLTVAPGTEVRVAPIDQEGNGVGDYLVRVDGRATLEGTAEAPIVFRTDGDVSPNDWERLRIVGANGSIAHLQVIGARVGLDAAAPGLQVVDTELTANHIGLEVNGGAPQFDRLDVHDNATTGIAIASPATLRVVRVADNGDIGLTLAGGASTLEDLLVSGNGSHGIHISTQGHSRSHLEITDNAGQGIDVRGAAGGTVQRCSITFNGGAGVHLRTDGDNHPLLAVTGCNIFGNASQEGNGTWTYREDVPNLAVTDNDSGAASAQSGNNDAAAQTFEVQTQFSVTAGLVGTGELIDGNAGTVLLSLNANATRWFDTEVRRLRVRANLTRCCGSASMTLRRVRQYTANVQQLEMSAGVFAAARVDARGNFWGVFPNVQARIHEVVGGSIDYSGFVPDALRNVGPRTLP